MKEWQRQRQKQGYWPSLGAMPADLARAVDHLNRAFPRGDPARNITHNDTLSRLLAEMDEQ